jgi:hypothetical protein
MDHVRAANARARLAELDAERDALIEALGEDEPKKKASPKKPEAKTD